MPVALAVVTLATAAVAACDNEVCKIGDPACGGASSTAQSGSTTKSSTQASTVVSSSSGEGGFIA